MQKSALRLAAVDERAAGEGLQVGMTLSDARARIPELEVEAADPGADLALLLRLLEACRRFTPALALHTPDGLDLDVTGCAGLFGGERALLDLVLQRMRQLGLQVQAALADTPALAYAAARFGGGGVVEAGVRAAVLAPLPVEALRLTPQGCTVLRGLGFKTVGQLLDLPRAALARRLGEEATARLDEALGHRACPLELSLEQPPLRAERVLFEPISEADQVLQVTADLAADLAVTLEGRGLGGRRFALDLFRVDGAVKRLEVAASRPLQHPPRIVSLFAERLAGLDEGLQADFGFDQLRLTALQTAELAEAPHDLLQAAPAAGAIEALADRIAARSRAEQPVVRRLASHAVHTPEAAMQAAEVARPCAWTDVPARFLGAPLRPLRLLHPPQPIEVPLAGVPEGPPARFVWRRVTRTVVRAEGPERLEPEWARRAPPLKVDEAPTPARDYYRLEDEQGRRYWVFRQGRYDERRYNAPAAFAYPAAAGEQIKPVRPAPKPEPTLEALKSPLLGARIQDATRPRPQLQLVSAAPRSQPQDAAVPDAVPARPAAPVWFLHGLFG